MKLAFITKKVLSLELLFFKVSLENILIIFITKESKKNNLTVLQPFMTDIDFNLTFFLNFKYLNIDFMA
jgi:hypothetical protein